MPSVFLQRAVEGTLDTMQAILHRTLADAQAEAGPGQALTVRHLELKLVQSLQDIRSPTPKVTATPLQ